MMLYPVQRACAFVLGVSEWALKHKILPAIEWLGANMDTLEWDGRLDRDNHAPQFPYLVTSVTDSFPVFIQDTKHPGHHNGKLAL